MVDASTIGEAAVAATLTVGFLGYLGGRRNSQETTVKDLFVNEQRARVNCEEKLREAQDRHHSALQALEAERDEHKQRADLLELELKRDGRLHRP